MSCSARDGLKLSNFSILGKNFSRGYFDDDDGFGVLRPFQHYLRYNEMMEG